MNAKNKNFVCGSRGGVPLQVVELDEQGWSYLVERTKKGLAMDWVMIGRRERLGRASVSVGVVRPDLLVQEIKAEAGRR